MNTNQLDTKLKQKERWFEVPWVIVVFVLFIPPVGFVLLGYSRKCSFIWKIAISCLACFLYFFILYQTMGGVNSSRNLDVNYLQEPFAYSSISFSSTDAAHSLHGIEVQPGEEEVFLQVNYIVRNPSDSPRFYVSLLDEPRLLNEEGREILPDLTVSQEPFGEFKKQEEKSGFLLFRIPQNFYPQSFVIQGSTYEIPENVLQKKENAS